MRDGGKVKARTVRGKKTEGESDGSVGRHEQEQTSDSCEAAWLRVS